MKRCRFDDIHSKVLKSVLPFLNENGGVNTESKCEKCMNSGKIPCETPDCYNCMVPDAKVRADLNKVIDSNSAKDVIDYQGKIFMLAVKNNIAKYKMIDDIIEAAMSLRRF